MPSLRRLGLWVSVLVAIAACGDSSSSLPDASSEDGGQLFPCSNPGQACNAHDPCAINPICGPDGLCRPTTLLNCDDGLDCTIDTCGKQGLCERIVKDGSCVVAIGGQETCFNSGETNPEDGCKECNPSLASEGWSPRNGGTCDDGDTCTKDDYCQDGTCQGTYYGDECADGLSCTQDVCNGDGTCGTPVLLNDRCLISGQCYSDQDSDFSGCNICDVSVNQTAWTALGAHCLINGTCYQPGQMDPTQCSVCDPAVSTTSWTPLTGKCLINGQCYDNNDPHPGGCAVCDTTQSTTQWTVAPAKCLISDVCYDPGATDTTGCGECNPTADPLAWTPVQGQCQIEGQCYTQGTIDPVTQCGECDTAVSSTMWTPIANKCLIDEVCYDDQMADASGCFLCDISGNPSEWTPVAGATSNLQDFEGLSALPTGWTDTFTDPAGAVKWQIVQNLQSASGSYALHYGNPATGDFDNGSTNGGEVTIPGVALTGTNSAIQFKLFMDTESGTTYDVLEIEVIGSTTQTVWTKSQLSFSQMQTWVNYVLDISSFAGQTVTIKISFDTGDSAVNGGQGVFIDDFQIVTGCN